MSESVSERQSMKVDPSFTNKLGRGALATCLLPGGGRVGISNMLHSMTGAVSITLAYE